MGIYLNTFEELANIPNYILNFVSGTTDWLKLKIFVYVLPMYGLQNTIFYLFFRSLDLFFIKSSYCLNSQESHFVYPTSISGHIKNT